MTTPAKGSAARHGRLRHMLLGAVVLVAGVAGFGLAGRAGEWPTLQDMYAPDANGAPAWADAAAQMAQSAPILRFFAPQTTPAIVPTFEAVTNPFGSSATYQPAGPTATAGNAFFASLGTNGRTCGSCHAASAGWSITPLQVQALFLSSLGTNPLFQPVDGANCPTANVSNLFAELSAYSLLLSKGLIRIFELMPAPPTLQYSIVAINDPYNCSANPATGLTSYGPNATTAGFLSVYRRPLPATNLGFLSTILFDGREKTLQQQAIDANRIHAQATTPATATQVAQMVAFEEGLYSAQTFSLFAGDLTSQGSNGGPIALSQQPFFIGINDSGGNNPTGAPFNEDVYSLYPAWLPGASGYANNWLTGPARASIARGEAIFNQRSFTISGVTGLNDVTGQASIAGTCSSCHDSPNAGSNSDFLMVDTGVAPAGAQGLDQLGLPVFTLQCNAGPLAGQTFVTTDPGKAILSGQCSDINRLKVPTLRNLAARPPYFHNGSAVNLGAVVAFYNARFSIGLSRQDQADLVNFLNAL
jgi:cytochrome c peroxidase